MPLNLVSKRYMCVIHVFFVVIKFIFGLTNSPKPYKHTGTLQQGTKLTFVARSRLAPKFSKIVAKAKKLGAIKKKDS